MLSFHFPFQFLRISHPIIDFIHLDRSTVYFTSYLVAQPVSAPCTITSCPVLHLSYWTLSAFCMEGKKKITQIHPIKQLRGHLNSFQWTLWGYTLFKQSKVLHGTRFEESYPATIGVLNQSLSPMVSYPLIFWLLEKSSLSQ